MILADVEQTRLFELWHELRELVWPRRTSAC